MKVDEVVRLISEIASNPEENEKITVLPLMCGSGKSTAISYLIRQTIEKAEDTGHGVLIVTDRIDRMSDYMHPYRNRDLQSFLQNNQDQVVIMTHDNAGEANKIQYYKPVLMMTTQRYFSLSVSEINNYLKWEKGPRPLVVIDERPELIKVVDLDSKKLSECDVAIKSAYPDSINAKPTKELQAVSESFSNFVKEIRDGACGQQDDVRCFWSWQTEDNLVKYDDYIDVFDNEYIKICNNRSAINSYGGGSYYDDIFTRIRAIRQLKDSLALFHQRKYNEKSYDDSMHSLLDNYDLIREIKAKVLILDGTADLSPEYLPDRYDFSDVQDSKRPLDHLHIKLINYPTGKTELKASKEKQSQLLDCVDLYFTEIISPEQRDQEKEWAIFTYNDLEKAFEKKFGKNRIEHFGNIKGKNDFTDSRHIFQVGLNRFPDEIYYLYYLFMHPEIAKQYNNMEEEYDYITYPADQGSEIIARKGKLNQDAVIAQSAAIEAEMKDLEGETQEIMNRVLLAEIEQNLFRGIIRNSDSQDDFGFHLFINTDNYKDLIQMIRQRYEPLGATVEFAELPVLVLLRKIMNQKRSTYLKRFIEWHDRVLKIDEEYTPNSIRLSIGMNENAMKAYEKMLYENPVISLLMREEKLQRGKYRKNKNWFFLE